MADPATVPMPAAATFPPGTGDSEAAKAALELERLVQQTEVAAREWGVRPDHLEGRFVSAFLAALTWLGRLVRAASADMKAAAGEHRTASAVELEALRAANAVAAKLQGQAQLALAVSDVQVSKVVTRFVESVAPQIVREISGAVVLRERRHNRDALWGRAAGIATVALALVGCGYTWAVWAADPRSAADAGAAARIMRCQAAPSKDARGEAFCPLKALLPPV